MTDFFTADTHFCHESIIRFTKRPYQNAAEMNEAMIEKWNARVPTAGRVFVIGDFSFRNPKGAIAPIFARLNGEKHLIIGNHDNREVLSLPWASQPTLIRPHRSRTATGEMIDIVMCHYPIRSWDGMYRGSIHLYGHEHGNVVDYDNACDVGVDRWNGAPVTIDEILARMRDCGPNPDHRKNPGPARKPAE